MADWSHSRWLRLPSVVAGVHFVFFLSVLTKRYFWSVGDSTDIIVPAVVEFPLGLVAAALPFGRTGAFIALPFFGALNALAVRALLKAVITSTLRPPIDEGLRLDE